MGCCGCARAGGRGMAAQLARDLLVVALALAPSLPQLGDIAARRNAWAAFVGQQRLHDVGRILTLLPLAQYVLLPAGICAAACGLRRWRSRPGGQAAGGSGGAAAAGDHRTLVLVACWLLVPLTAAWCLTALEWARLFFVRYVSVTLVVPPVLAGWCCAACPTRWSRAVAAAAVLTATLWSGGMWEQCRRDGRFLDERNQDWRSAVQLLQHRAGRSRSPVFVRSGLLEADRLRTDADERWREYCLLPVRGIYRLDVGQDTLVPLPTTGAGRLAPAECRRIAAAGEAWFLLLSSVADLPLIRREILRSVRAAGGSAEFAEQWEFGDVYVLRLTAADCAGARALAETVPGELQRGGQDVVVRGRRGRGGSRFRHGLLHFLHDHVRKHPVVADGLAAGRVELGRGQPHAGFDRVQREDALHRAFAVAALADHGAAAVVLHGPGEDLGWRWPCRRRSAPPAASARCRRHGRGSRNLPAGCVRGWRRCSRWRRTCRPGRRRPAAGRRDCRAGP